MSGQLPINPLGCERKLCLSFNFVDIMSILTVNLSVFGVGVWRNRTNTTIPNHWSITQPSYGVANIFDETLFNTGVIKLYEDGVFVDKAYHVSGGVSNYTYKLYYFNGGVLNEIINLNTIKVLTPNAYVIKIIDSTQQGDNGLDCEYKYSFSINSSNSFIPNNSFGNLWCNKWGCNDASANNFVTSVNANNGSCDYNSSDDVYGCTNISACNFEFTANLDDGSCTYNCYGCTDPRANNHNTASSIPCNGTFINCVVPGENCCCDYLGEVFGCLDVYSLNHDVSATIDDGSCTYLINGCTNPLADNFNPTVSNDDGSCEIPGCTDDGTDQSFPGRLITFGTASNYNKKATYDNGSCVYDDCFYGCTDPSSTNFNPSATCDDGSCYGGCCGKTDSGEYVITGHTSSKLSEVMWPSVSNTTNVLIATTDVGFIDRYGANQYYPLKKRVPSKGVYNGWTEIRENLYTAYTIDNIHYWDYDNIGTPIVGRRNVGDGVTTRFAVNMVNCCPGCLYPDIKEEWSLGHVFPPQIENNVFIDRGQISIFEDHYRISEIKRIEDFGTYQGGFFNIIKQN